MSLTFCGGGNGGSNSAINVVGPVVQDFCHGMMQILQGAVDARAALHCTVSDNLRRVMKASPEGKASKKIPPCADCRLAVFIPAALIQLGIAQVRPHTW